jgi:putative intracellular protease/amidase
MNPESHSWSLLNQQAASRLRPGLADRVLRAARERAESIPSLFSQFAVGAVTAALCFGALAVLAMHQTASAAVTNQPGWQEIASASNADPGLAP